MESDQNHRREFDWVRSPDWGKLVFEDGALLEPNLDGGRLVLWVPGECDRKYRYWQRISSSSNGDREFHNGVIGTSAASVTVRERINIIRSKFLGIFRSAKSERAWVLPNGALAEPWGRRRTDLILAWAKFDGGLLDEVILRSIWPESEDVRQIGSNVFLVLGINLQANATSESVGPKEIMGHPRELAEGLLNAARRTGNRRSELTALVDLGVLSLNNGKSWRALAKLERALVLANQFEDAVKKCDVLSNLARVSLVIGRRKRARRLFRRSLAVARKAKDRYAEKLALEFLGTFFLKINVPARALAPFRMALDLARVTGDRHHEAKLLWHLSVVQAELGQPDQAIAQGQLAVALFDGLGRPEATWFAARLEKYQAATAVAGCQEPRVKQSEPTVDPCLGGLIEANVMSDQSSLSPVQDYACRGNGLGLLHLAGSSKAKAKFLRSSAKPVPLAVCEERIQVCANCEYVDGLRCRVGGFFVYIKSRIEYEKCPLGKWPLHVNIVKNDHNGNMDL